MTIGALSVSRGADEAAERRAVDSFARQGFTPSFRWQWGDGRLQLWLNRERATSETAVKSVHGLACAVGTLWYRGAFGTAALERLLVDAAAAERQGPGIDESLLRGTFACFLETQRGRWLLNDALGFARIYRSADANFYSTSWLAARAYAATNVLDEEAATEYVLIGASHSERTPFSGVTRLRLGHGIDLDANTEQSRFPAGLVPAPYVRHASFDDAVERISSRLAESFDEITSAFPGRTSAALSGGFDSRLIVASLLANGERPRLFVYGADESEDVRIARQIAAGENVPMRCFDKTKMNAALPACEVEDLARNALFFDGLPTDGVDDPGADRLTRLEQNADGFIALNGGGGEIFRNFFYLPDRPFRPIDLVRTFYRGFDAGAFRRTGALTAYEHRMALSIASSIGLSGGESDIRRTITREQVELVYPFFRCHHWMGLNNSISIRYGHFTTPLVTLQLVREAVSLPIAWKNTGAFESRLIAARHAAVAGYPSSYGFRVVDGPNARARRHERLTRLRPAGLRPYIAAARRWLHDDRVSAERIAGWRAKLPGEWRIDPVLDLSRLDDGAFDRALSIEVVARELAP